MKLRDLVQEVPCRIRTGNPNLEIRGVADHSGRVGEGFLFAAIEGHRRSGTDFLKQAQSRGATAILSRSRPEPLPAGCAWLETGEQRLAIALIARNFYRRPDEALTVLGITGTNGKTTVSYLVESVLIRAGLQTARLGTIEYRFGGKTETAGRTTPSPVDLYRILAAARDAGDSHCVLEVSSHALDQKRAAGMRYTAAVFTNLTRDHLDYHGDLEEYFSSKKTLFDCLPEQAPALINIDDPYGQRLAREHPGKILTFGLSPEAWCRPEAWASTPEGLRVDLRCGDETFMVASALLGKPNLYNLLAAAAAGSALGMAPETIAAGLGALDRIPGRMEKIDEGQDFLALVDFAHSPDALEQLLKTVRDLRPARILSVIGCGGDRDPGKRRPMGKTGAALSDMVFLTSDNPRTEDPEVILKEMEKGARSAGPPRGIIEVIPDRKQAIRAALLAAREGDAVVVAGKGHETTQELPTGTVPFDDRQVIREILRANGYGEPTYGAA